MRWGVTLFEDCDEQWKLIRCAIGLSISLAGLRLRSERWGTLHGKVSHVTRWNKAPEGCSVTLQIPVKQPRPDATPHRRYGQGSMFGEPEENLSCIDTKLCIRMPAVQSSPGRRD
jgi:hypothetical protein